MIKQQCTQEDLSSDLQNLHKKPTTIACACHPCDGEMRGEGVKEGSWETLGTAVWVYMVKVQVSKRPCLR